MSDFIEVTSFQTKDLVLLDPVDLLTDFQFDNQTLIELGSNLVTFLNFFTEVNVCHLSQSTGRLSWQRVTF